ncbi:hypothetical protein WT35_21025 [Burkholderia stagnalis]|nr:hypothetical protein WT35_21025 [Burkholderia stagnalis]
MGAGCGGEPAAWPLAWRRCTIVALCFSTGPPREWYLRAKKWVDRAAAGAISALGLRLILTAPKAGTDAGCEGRRMMRRRIHPRRGSSPQHSGYCASNAPNTASSGNASTS